MFKKGLIALAIGILIGVIYTWATAELRTEELNKLPNAIPAVNVQTIEVFSIFTFGGAGYNRKYFHDVTGLKIEGCGAWFTHEGKRKYINGNFVIEPTPKPLYK